MDIALQRGDVTGFLGLNGAGKTTTMRMLCGTLAPDEGTIAIAGIDLQRDPQRARAKIGFLPDTPPLYPELTVDEYLDYSAKLRCLPKTKIPPSIERVKAQTGLEDRAKQRISGLSRGYQQRLGIAQAIIHQPSVVVLDEPTSGLDPRQIESIRTLIKSLSENAAVLLSTHLLAEVQTVCNRVVIIHEGEIVQRGEVDDSLEKTFFDITGGSEPLIWTIAHKEWRTLFRSPLTWIALAVIQFIFAWIFLLALESWLQIQAQQTLRSDNPGVTAWLLDQCFAPASTLLLAISPLLTMRLIADERRSSGIELLLSSPISPWQIVCGKFLAAFGVYVVLLIQLMLMPLVLTPFTGIDIGALLTASFGLLLFCAGCCAVGVYFSALTRQSAVAALGCFGALFLLWVAGIAQNDASSTSSALFSYLSVSQHLYTFLTGLLSSVDVIYYLLLCTLFMALAVRHIDNLRIQSKVIAHRINGALFSGSLLLICAAIAWLSTQYPLTLDATAQGRHSLSQASVDIVSAIDGSISIEAWLEPNAQSRRAISTLISRYQKHKADMSLQFFDPVKLPSQAREKAIHPGGELIVRWEGREQRVQSLSEKSLSHALLRLARAHSPKVRFVSGHLERQAESNARHGYLEFVSHLRAIGFTVETLSLITTPVVPADTDILVIAAAAGDYFPGEAASVLNYVANGGNLLWLLEPNQAIAPVELSGELGLSVLPGVIVDVAAQQLSVDTPDFAVIDNYPPHPALPERLSVSLFPQAAGLAFPATIGWSVEPLLTTSENSWTETGQIAGQISYNENGQEQAGPITLGAALTRQRGQQQQRITVIGDADFLANSWLGNGGNRYLGQQLFNWLSGDQQFPQVAPLQAADAQLNLSKRIIAVLGLTFLVILPGTFILMAFLSWRKRAG